MVKFGERSIFRRGDNRPHDLDIRNTGWVDCYMDHHSFTFLFEQLAVVPGHSISSTRKLLHWSVRLRMCSYRCLHIKGIDDVCANIKGRRSQPPTIHRTIKIPELSYSALKNLFNKFFNAEYDSGESFAERHWDCKSVKTVQRCTPKEYQNGNLTMVPRESLIWILDDSTELQLRLCVIADNGSSGYPCPKSTESTLRK